MRLIEEPETGLIRAQLLDWGEAETCGNDCQDALAMAADLLETLVSIAVAEDTPIPEPSIVLGAQTVSLSAVSAAKVELYLALRESGITQADLARRLRWHPPQVFRLLDLRHNSKMDQLEQALAALGKRLVVSVQDAA
ncbi:MAG: type II toxin-antitoxin system HicB family antitoxin [Magnetococcales bacterium]|nr:type II toxin-antitoxin system HicB family antitoxin [Magnetococcales bacterium]